MVNVGTVPDLHELKTVVRLVTICCVILRTLMMTGFTAFHESQAYASMSRNGEETQE